jgi:anti-sigma factor RsiW
MDDATDWDGLLRAADHITWVLALLAENARLTARVAELAAGLTACEVAMDTAGMNGLPQQLPPAYRESWADAHTTLRTLLAGQPGAG